MGFLLFIISLVFKRILELPMYLFGSVIACLKGEWNQYNMDLAIATDQYGNGLSKYLFNILLIKKTAGHKFGNIDETISSVIGKNKVAGTLTWLGRVVDIVLDSLDPNHSIDAIDNSEN
jgi:uncharacterized membrane protein YcfT